MKELEYGKGNESFDRMVSAYMEHYAAEDAGECGSAEALKSARFIAEHDFAHCKDKAMQEAMRQAAERIYG